MKAVKSRKIRNNKKKNEINFDVKSEIIFEDKKVEKKQIRKRKIRKKEEVKSNDIFEKEIFKIHKVRGRKLYLENKDISDKFFVEKISTRVSQIIDDIKVDDIVSSKDEYEDEYDAEEKISIGFVVLILTVCLVVGFISGYLAYRLIFS